MKFFSLFVYLFLSLPNLFSCALCALYTPGATVEVALKGDDTLLKETKITWTFGQDFIKELLARYDTDQNGKLDQNELIRVEKILLNYLVKKHYLTSIEYALAQKSSEKIEIKAHQTSFIQTDNTLIFTYTIPLNKAMHPQDTLSFVFEDTSGYFTFLVHKVEYTVPSMWKLESNINNNILFINIQNPEALPVLTVEKPIKIETTLPLEANNSNTLRVYLLNMQKKIEMALTEIKTSHSWVAYGLFLGFSFLYGLLHAAGPGHGKALVSSYFFATKQSYSKALSVSFLIGIVHTFSAFLMTLVIYAIFDLFFKEFFDDFTFYATKVSAVIILVIAGYLFYKKRIAYAPLPKIASFSAHPPSCSCGGCSSKSQSTDFGVIVAAGIVPCPGTITIFIFTLSMGEYFIGFLSATFMGLGMSAVIFSAAILSIRLKKGFGIKNVKFLKYADYASLGIIAVLGLGLLFA